MARKRGRGPLKPYIKRDVVNRVLGYMHSYAHDAYEAQMFSDAVTKSLAIPALIENEAKLKEASELAARLKELGKELVHAHASEQNIRNLRKA